MSEEYIPEVQVLEEQTQASTLDFAAGVTLLMDKPMGWSSYDVVKKLQFALKFKKIGHAGTLDPLATGLLILCTGKKTKQIDLIQAEEKEYTGHFLLGGTTPSYDAESPVDQIFPTDHISHEMLIEASKDFVGHIAQCPPMYSAIKIDGKRLYKLARRNISVELKPRDVFVQSFEIDTSQFPVIAFKVVCSKGTYIRSLVHDLGQKVGSGAYLTSLRRTRIGEFQVSDAWQLSDFVALYGTKKVQA